MVFGASGWSLLCFPALLILVLGSNVVLNESVSEAEVRARPPQRHPGKPDVENAWSSAKVELKRASMELESAREAFASKVRRVRTSV